MASQVIAETHAIECRRAIDPLKKAVAEMASGTDQPDPVIIINADGATSHQSVIDILEAARIAGLSKITFAAQSHVH